MAGETEEDNRLKHKIAKILDEARTSFATHNRKLKELSAVRSKSSSPLHFFSAFSKILIPLFTFQRRIASTERVVRFVSVFAGTRDPNNASDCDEFLAEFLRFLLNAAAAANRTARFRACQIVSEVWCRFWVPFGFWKCVAREIMIFLALACISSLMKIAFRKFLKWVLIGRLELHLEYNINVSPYL